MMMKKKKKKIGALDTTPITHTIEGRERERERDRQKGREEGQFRQVGEQLEMRAGSR
jgi:hypothetical protein